MDLEVEMQLQKMDSISVKRCCLQMLPLTSERGSKGFEKGTQSGEEDGSGRTHWQPQSMAQARRE